METEKSEEIFTTKNSGIPQLEKDSISNKDEKSEIKETAASLKPSATFGIRHVQTLLLFFGLTVAYALRVNLSVAIVAMTDNSISPGHDEYQWSDKTRSVLLSSFFWGYVVTQVPGGTLSAKYGAKYTLFFGILVCSLLTILTPICASIGDWKLVVALRVLEGASQGFLFPSTHTLLSKWAPVEERGRLGTYCYSGSQAGTVIMLASSGVLASSSMGWPSIFYFSGSAGVIWSIFWFIFGASTPSDCKRISAEERKYIETSLGKNNDTHSNNLPTPWAKMLTSMPFISLIIVHCSHNWGFWTLLTEIPTYMKNILGMDIKKNALLSALPYFAMMMLSYFFSFLADVLYKKQWISIAVSRKLFNSIGHWIPMLTLIGLGYVTDNVSLAITLLTVTVGINAATYLGFQVNHIDLSPNYAGTLMGITNCAANIMSIIAPLLVGFIVTDGEDPNQWRIVFFVSAGFYFVGNLLFIIFGRTQVQSWNEPNLSGTNQNGVRRTSVLVEALESHN